MPVKKRKLPVDGIQTFRKLRREYDVYVDKTMHVYKMVQNHGATFLARPRRFGKSLLCSTLASLFRGERELFENLLISQTDWDWKVHPVIHLGLAADDYTDNGVDMLVDTLNRQLDKVCDDYGISVERSDSIAGRFSSVITELDQKIGSVVVIIDEYDNPLLSTVNQPKLHEKMREKMKGFYSVIKQYEGHLRFAFITGVAKFTQVSVFSGMNQPHDISMMPEYCDVCGITQKELEAFFAPEIEMFAEKHGGRENYLQKLKDNYDGYRFTDEEVTVYNPYGLLNHFINSAKFAPYWSQSGTPSFLLKYFEMKKVDSVRIEEARMEAGRFANYKDNTITLFPLLYQTGYLTISDYDEKNNIYSLNYPNIEVRKTLAEFLATTYSKSQNIWEQSPIIGFRNALLDCDINEFMNTLKWYLANVDYSLSSKITEYYFEFAASNIINMLGFVCKNQVHTANGRMDSVIFAEDYIYILEFKVDKPVENALRQIERKDYGLVYAKSGKKIVKTGIVFSRETRNIVEWMTCQVSQT